MMSWSVNYVGKPEKVAAALQEQSSKLTGQSKIEFDDALPHLVGLVNQTFLTEKGAARGYQSNLVQIEANGSGTSFDVTIKPIYGAMV